jgi:PII-like signaling protein
MQPGPAKKVEIYVSENQQYHHEPAARAILDFLFYHGVAGATMTHGAGGFGADHHMRAAEVLTLSGGLPVKIEFIETAAKAEELLPKLADMAGHGLIEVHDTTVYKAAVARNAPRPAAPAHIRLEGTAKLMRIYIGENDRWRDRPLSEALVESLRAHDIAGVTVYRGILGYGAAGRLHRERVLSHDRPVMLSVVDGEDKLRAILPLLDEMMTSGLIALSDVEVIKYSHRPAAPAADGKAAQ